MLLCVIGCGWKTRAGVSLANVLSVNNVSLFLKKGRSVKDLIMTPGEFLLSLDFYVNALELIKGKQQTLSTLCIPTRQATPLVGKVDLNFTALSVS